MTEVLFPQRDDENSPIPDRSARAERKRGAVGREGAGSPPVSNTGDTITTIPNIKTKSIPPEIFALQGVSGSSYRFWRCPSVPEDNWEMVYSNVIPLETANPKAAGVDWLHIVFRWGDSEQSISDLDGVLRDSLGFGLFEEQKIGRFNYSRQFLLADGKSRFFIGGSYQRGTALLSFPGSALQFLDLEKIRGLGEYVLKGWITRVDFCADFYNGEYMVEHAMNDYRMGKFNLSGKKPKHKYIGSIPGEVDLTGQTLYIGSRENGKCLRVYEKGKQQGVTRGALSKWTRVELELHGSNPEAKNRRVIPWDVLSRPGCYLAGGYKALEFISETCSRIKRVAVKVVSSMKKTAVYLKKVGGKFVNALKNMGMNDASIVELIRGGELPDYFDLEDFKSFGIEVEELRKWCVDVFGEEQNFILLPEF